MNFKKIGLTALALATVLSVFTIPAFAEGDDTPADQPDQAPPIVDDDGPVYFPVIDDGHTFNLTLKYFDDFEETVPITGAEFEILQIATLDNNITTGLNGAYVFFDESLDFINTKPIEIGSYIEPEMPQVDSEAFVSPHSGDSEDADVLEDLQESADIAAMDAENAIESGEVRISRNEEIVDFEEPDALEYEKQVLKLYEKNPDVGYRATAVVGENGLAVFNDIPAGAYLVREIKTMRYHIRSIPFVASVPETNEESNSWNFDVVLSPKQILAGDIEVSKVLEGEKADKNDVFTFQITLTAGEYKGILPDGTETIFKSGDKVYIKGGETFTIFDVPAGTYYSVVEIEANKNGYETRYTNGDGTVQEKTVIKPTITNLKRIQRTRGDTGAGDHIILLLSIGGGVLAMLCLLLYLKRKQKSEEK